MPLYEYLCEACGQRFELIQKFSDPAPDACPKCGKGPVERQLSSPAIQFKGSGWYITDYARKSGGASGEASSKPSSESASSSESSGDSKKTESKKTDTAPASSAPASTSDKA